VYTIEAAFIADILANPGDDFPRLVLADWLDDQQSEPSPRAEFIRDQVFFRPGSIDFDLLDSNLEQWCPWFSRHDELGFRRCSDKAGAIEVRHFGGQTTFWRRGFIAEVRCTMADWIGTRCSACLEPNEDVPHPKCRLCHGPAIVQCQPVEVVEVSDRRPFSIDYGWHWQAQSSRVEVFRHSPADQLAPCLLPDDMPI